MKWLTSAKNEDTTEQDGKPVDKVNSHPLTIIDEGIAPNNSAAPIPESTDINSTTIGQNTEHTDTITPDLRQNKSDTKNDGTSLKNSDQVTPSEQQVTSKVKDAMHRDVDKISERMSTNYKKKKVNLSIISRFFLLVVIGILTYLSYLGRLTVWLRQVTGSEHIDAVNLHYLTSAKEYTADLLGILTESKIVVAVLQSSQGGISFIVDVQVQLGQVLSSLHDAINFAWKITLSSLSSIEFLSILLETSHFSMSLILTLFSILLGLIICFGRRYQRISQLLAKITTTLGFIVLLTHVLLPYAIYGTATLSKHILTNHKSEVYRGYSELHRQLPQHKQDAGLKDKVQGTMSHFKDKKNNLNKHSKKLPALSAKHLTLTFIEYLFMPLLIMYLLIMLTKQIFHSLHLRRSYEGE